MKKIHWLLPLVVFVACTTDAPPTTTAIGSHKVDTATLSTAFYSPYHDAKAVVLAWNEGINNRDWALLESVYANDVYYYGRQLARAETLQRKKKALERAPSFSQTIEDIKIQRLYKNTQEAFFNKSYQHDSIRNTVVGILALYHDPEQGWKITQESDHLSRKKQGNKVCSCSEFLVALYKNGDATAYKNIHFFDGEPYYTSDDGQRILFVYPDAEEVVFLEKENRGTHAAALGSAQIFSLKDQKMRRDTYSAKGDAEVPVNRRFLEQMGAFCR
jgi:hypothetical protein